MARRGTTTTRTIEHRLITFCRVAEDAVSRRAIQQGTIGAAWSLRGQVDEPVELTTDLGDIEDVRSLLLDVRKFFLNDEAAHFPSVANILEKRLTDNDLRDANRTNRRSWKNTMEGGLVYNHNGTCYTAERMFDLMVNGGMFHFDDVLAATWDGLDPMSRGMMQAQVHGLVLNCVAIAHAQRNVIRQALNHGSLDLT